jgi:hypothetical protein
MVYFEKWSFCQAICYRYCQNSRETVPLINKISKFIKHPLNNMEPPHTIERLLDIGITVPVLDG